MNLKQSKVKIYKQPLQIMAKDLVFEQPRQSKNFTTKLEIDIVLICLNTFRYVLVGVIWLCLYASR